MHHVLSITPNVSLHSPLSNGEEYISDVNACRIPALGNLPTRIPSSSTASLKGICSSRSAEEAGKGTILLKTELLYLMLRGEVVEKKQFEGGVSINQNFFSGGKCGHEAVRDR